MRYEPKGTAALHILAGFPIKARVELEPDGRVSVKTVGELQRVTTWPRECGDHDAQERYPEVQ